VEFYAALVVALALAAVAAVLYYYVMFLEGRARLMRRRIQELERANALLLEELSGAADAAGPEDDAESWPEVLDAGDGLPRG
jgi:ABC-type bacteriocin/lantibiotic exporter with double-glycine peptidase domain